MIHFGRRLISRGLRATLLTSVFISQSTNLASPVGGVHLDAISDGFDGGGFSQAASIDDYLRRLKEAGSSTLSDLITKYETTPYPVTALVYEPFLPWALDVAKDHGLYAAWPVRVPGWAVELEPRDVPSFVNAPEAYPAYFAMVVNQFSNTDKADHVLINTYYELEKEALDTMSKVCPVLAIGPTVPSIYLDNRIPNDDEYGVDLFTLQRSTATTWITTKPPNSRTNHPFIWVIRDTELAKLPHTFVHDLGDSALVVNWAPQVEILASGKVGCFFTHCGWNSTIEALSLGIPMVAFPQWTDQPPNAKLVEDVWRAGVRVTVEEDGMARGEELERCLREVMEGESGREMKRSVEKWRELAVLAVSEGGSSDQSLDEFVARVKSVSS
ncbi:unnamed protein product [Linum tenue]|uniref:anthocyanidin 3-O-glucosyltransferase n=1 Tax=Linum tenue TaxID=586396 RepID=A0AAV0QJE4_9ROSI|nr:unnamed protein product [Linum tenue]